MSKTAKKTSQEIDGHSLEMAEKESFDKWFHKILTTGNSPVDNLTKEIEQYQDILNRMQKIIKKYSKKEHQDFWLWVRNDIVVSGLKTFYTQLVYYKNIAGVFLGRLFLLYFGRIEDENKDLVTEHIKWLKQFRKKAIISWEISGKSKVLAVVVAGVLKNTEAYRLGISRGDIVEKFDGEKVQTLNDFERIKNRVTRNLKKGKKATILIKIIKKRKTTISLTPIGIGLSCVYDNADWFNRREEIKRRCGLTGGSNE